MSLYQSLAYFAAYSVTATSMGLILATMPMLTVLLATLSAAHPAAFAFAFETGLALAALLLATLAAAHATAAFTLEIGLAALLPRSAFIFLLLLALAALLALTALLLLAL